MLASLITGLISGEALAAMQRAKRRAVTYMIAGVFFLFALVFLLVAAYVAAAQRLGPIEAALVFAGAFILVAILVIAFGRLGGQRVVRRSSNVRSRELSRIAVTTGLALLPTLLRGRAGKAALIAPAIAAVVYFIYRENTRTPVDDALD